MILLAAFATILPAGAQKVGFINTDSVMVALPEYQAAVKQLDAQADQYKQELQNTLASIDRLYNNYQSQKAYLSASQRTSYENDIISREQQMKKRQDECFGAEGLMAKASEQLLSPIRSKVTSAVSEYCEANGYTLILDLAVSAGIVYKNGADDITKEIINILK